MEEDTHYHQAELPASAQEDVLTLHGESSRIPGCSVSQASKRPFRRFCSRPTCTWVLAADCSPSSCSGCRGLQLQVSSVLPVLPDTPEGLEVSAVDSSVFFMDGLTADDLASQQSFKPPLGSLCSYVPPATDPCFPALSLSLDPDLIQFSVLSPQSPATKRCVQSHQVREPWGTVQEPEVPPKH
ncbi:hypothetical protein E2C01_067047 [Portunus trituberculatus]|uniref:Uncharacterized protein n=1 Tax=Portunus trituberculatus TaxID=210409 RepID=A0A5B7HSK8_PORTR|nr:hypothetical protein [Portunus trituberculatus]